ncbi:hypothetical protein BH11PSE12_BH11PSE12_20540 [soil metagenome]
MQSTEKRIAALEATGNAAAFRCIRLQLGETEQEARRRCDVADDVTDILFIRRVIVHPTESSHASH